MNRTVLREFLSEDNLNLHISHMKNASYKYSILEKSIKGLQDKSLYDLPYLRLCREDRDEAINLLSYIESHKCYFDSFAHLNKKCNSVRKYFGSEEKFLYEIFETSRYETHAFLYVYLDNRRRAKIEVAAPESVYIKFNPVLALDIYEHAYFLDYGFEKEKYLRAAISRLDIEKLDKALT